MVGRYAGRSTIHPNDRKMVRVRSYVMARDTDPVTRLVMCGICGHSGGVDGVDHIVPASECESRGISLWATDNLRAAHSKVPCPTCSVAANRQIFCNALRGALSTPAARLKISKLTGLRIVEVDASKHGGKLARPAEEPDRWLAKCAMYQVIPVAESREVQAIADYLSALFWTLPRDEWEREGAEILVAWREQTVQRAHDVLDQLDELDDGGGNG